MSLLAAFADAAVGASLDALLLVPTGGGRLRRRRRGSS